MSIHVTVVGSGMIVHEQILPSLYHLQRSGTISDIWVCATRSTRLRELADEPEFARAFPGQRFKAFPDLDADPGRSFPNLYRDVVARTPKRSMVVIATPEALHHEMVTYALEHDQHVLCVKPLVLKYEHAAAVEKLARARNLFVGVEYHKRFDRRSLETRESYRRGRFGEFRLGESRLIEPFYYRHSNFQNWFVKEDTDPFTYIGCHYVDLLYFISGLRPVEVSVKGVEGTFPNGNRAWMWATGRVTFENGGVLTCLNGLGYPDAGAGSNDQGLTLYCEDGKTGAVVQHNDQFRGVQHCYTQDAAAGGKAFRYVNPDYFRLIPWSGKGLRPVGYGYESVEASVLAAAEVNASNDPAQTLRTIDERGIIATPANSSINELVIEAARLSIMDNARPVAIEYEPAPRVRVS